MSPRVSRTLPTVEPILLTPRRDPFDDFASLFEPKYDGYRGLLYVARKGCHFRSKRGNVLKRFQELCYWVREELPVKEAILDGEVVALDSEGRQNFRDLVAGRGNLHYAAFDALWVTHARRTTLGGRPVDSYYLTLYRLQSARGQDFTTICPPSRFTMKRAFGLLRILSATPRRSRCSTTSVA